MSGPGIACVHDVGVTMLVHPLSLHGQVPELRMHQLGQAELQRSATPAGTGNAFKHPTYGG